MPTQTKFVRTDTTKAFTSANSNSVILELLWGDKVEIQSNTITNGRYKVHARWAKNVYVQASDLQDDALLEFYFIDVGQGDGVLIVTPDRRHIMLDGGYTRAKQPHGKSAADFVDWKFFVENDSDTIDLDAMIISHCDADHYGGLWDLLNTDMSFELDTRFIHVKDFYHAGISWWKDASHSRFLGREENGALVDLLSGKTSLNNALKDSADLKLQGEWAEFMRCVAKSGATVTRLSYHPEKDFDYLPGYEADKEVAIKILGPVEHTHNGKPALKDLGGDSQNTNGNSILLRVDYGKSRILLTGDLNLKSQQYILESFEGNKQELAADVVKACHHGSDDCSFEFLQYVQAAATIISSGDDETHAHPRPNIIAASGATGFRKITGDKLVTPLVYSTEISRSLRIGDPYAISYEKYETALGQIDVQLEDETKTVVSYTHTTSGALQPEQKVKTLNRLKVVDGIVYGLVNVRTDGNKILCATLNEGKSKWEIKTFYSRF
jgi:beta-lactamase superfamily II metal-dependent hydrolase